MADSTLPVIDLSDFERRKPQIAQDLFEAFRDIGFCYVRARAAQLRRHMPPGDKCSSQEQGGSSRLPRTSTAQVPACCCR